MDDEDRDKVSELPSRSSVQTRRQQNSSSSSPSSSSSEEGLAPLTRASSVSVSSPSEDEFMNYFGGLAGNPKLVARTSTEPYPPPNLHLRGAWPSPHYDELRSVQKMIFNIGQHPIVQVFNQGPRAEILSTLHGLPWYRMDVLRIGYYYAAGENPVVVLITVKPGEVKCLRGQHVVENCRRILQKYVFSTL